MISFSGSRLETRDKKGNSLSRHKKMRVPFKFPYKRSYSILRKSKKSMSRFLENIPLVETNLIVENSRKNLFNLDSRSRIEV